MTQRNLAVHHASVTVHAPVHQVYTLFTHFNDFPKFMSFVKEVTYYDNQTSHWVAEVVGQHEWDAVNENWIPDQQIGWHSTKGLDNFGKVTFEPRGNTETQVDVFINYNPPAGILGAIGEKIGAGSHFEHTLQNDLNHFAQMVDQSPPETLDPNSSSYLFHDESTAAQGKTTERQNATMSEKKSPTERQNATKPQQENPKNTAETRPTLDKDIIQEPNRPRIQNIDRGANPIQGSGSNPVQPPDEPLSGSR